MKHLLAFIFLNFCACSPLHVTKASYYQAKLLASRKPISSILIEPEGVSLETKRKLKLSQVVRSFAATQGLSVKKQFSQYADASVPTLWVLTASPKLSLKQHTWWFPVVGRLPYKGFFSKKESQEESQHLQEKNYDTHVRSTAAYSTLGWFNDPITPKMIELDTLAYIDTIFHELFHVNLWVPGNAAFNESLANVFGQFTALKFSQVYHPDMTESAKKHIKFDCRFSNLIHDTYNKLDTAYASADEAEKTKLKDTIFKNFSRKFSQLRSTFYPQKTQHKLPSFNNASLLGLYLYYKYYPSIIHSMLHYDGETDFFHSVLRSKDLITQTNADDPIQGINKTLNINSLGDIHNVCDMLDTRLDTNP